MYPSFGHPRLNQTEESMLEESGYDKKVLGEILRRAFEWGARIAKDPSICLECGNDGMITAVHRICEFCGSDNSMGT